MPHYHRAGPAGLPASQALPGSLRNLGDSVCPPGFSLHQLLPALDPGFPNGKRRCGYGSSLGSSQLCLCMVMTAAHRGGRTGAAADTLPRLLPPSGVGRCGHALLSAPPGNQRLPSARGNRPGSQAPLPSEELLAVSRRQSSPEPCPGLLRSEHCKVRPRTATASPSCRLVSINCISGQIFSLTRAETEDCSYLSQI